MLNVIQRAIDVQMYSMGSSVYEERTWKKKAPPVISAAANLTEAPVTTEPSLALKCPYSGASLSSVPPPVPPPEAVSLPNPPPPAVPPHETSVSKCPYHSKETDASSEIPETLPKPVAKCPFDSGARDDDDRLSLGSLDDGETGGSCPFGAIQPELPAVTEDTFQSIAERFQGLSSTKDEKIFEKQFLEERCVFVAYDGTMLPW